MSEIKSTRELPEDFHNFFHIICDAFPNFHKGKGNHKVQVRVNHNNPDIVTLEVGGFRITTIRSAWAVVIGALVDIIGAQNIEITVPAKTFRIEFDDTNLEAKVVAQ